MTPGRPGLRAGLAERGPELLAALSALVVIGTLGLREIDTPDFFFHVALGKCLLAGQWPPALDTLYFTPTTTGWLADLRNSFAGDIILAFVSRGGFPAVQFLCLGLLFAGGWVLWRHHRQMSDHPPEAVIIWCAAALYALGTLPLQAPRNATFSILLVPLCLVLTTRALQSGGWAMVAPAALFGIWTTVHASYLLGLVLVGAMAVGSTVDHFPRAPQLRRAAIVTALCLAACLPANPSLLHYFSLPLHNLAAIVPPSTPPGPPPVPSVPASGIPAKSIAASETDAEGASEIPLAVTEIPPAPARPSASSGLVARLAATLLAPMWGASGAGPRSGDFLPSWQASRYLPVTAALLLGLGTLGVLLSRGLGGNFTRLFPLLVTLYFAVCYARGGGYLTIVSLWCLAGITPADRPQSRRRDQSLALGLAGTAAVFGFAALTGTIGRVLGENTHTFGLGTSVLPDAPLCKWIEQRAPLTRPFTTVLSGSFALGGWQPVKPVFIDAFFPAHRDEVWRAYLTAQRDGSTEALVEPYSLDAALVENCRDDWQSIWRDDTDFFPAALGLGMTFYRARTDPERTPEVEILFDEPSLVRVRNVVTRHNAAAQVLNLDRQLDLLAEPADLTRFRQKYAGLLAGAPRFLLPGPDGSPVRDAEGYWKVYR